MGLQIAIGTSTFLPLAMSNGLRYAKSFNPGSAKTDLQRYHLRNCQGNLLGIGATIEVPITCVVRYIDTQANVWAAYQADVTAWTNPAEGVSIACNGLTFTSCRLKDEGARIVRDPQATGRAAGIVFMDAEFQFISDAG